MGYGALFTGHSHPLLQRAVSEQFARGTLFVSPCEDNAVVAELLAARFGLPQWRFTNSGTEATMDAIRLARGDHRQAADRESRRRLSRSSRSRAGIDQAVARDAGPASGPHAVPATEGLPPGVFGRHARRPLQRFAGAEAGARGAGRRLLHRRAGDGEYRHLFTPSGIPRGGSRADDAFGTLLLFDEVKTGITASWHGAASRHGVLPDLIARREVDWRWPAARRLRWLQRLHGRDHTGRVLHVGTYNGNPLCMAAGRAVLGEICTPEETDRIISRNAEFVARLSGPELSARSMPAHAVQCGAKGCVTWSSSPVDQLSRLPGDRFRAGVRPVDLGREPWRSAAAGAG